jgi:hypothetical protein
MLTDIGQSFINGVGGFGDAIGYLFLSPFERITNVISDTQVLQMLNWVLPMAEIIAILQAWLLAIGGWYVAKVGLRWLKVIS